MPKRRVADGKACDRTTSTQDEATESKWVCTAMGACRWITCWTQPPDAENRMSGGVGGLTGVIPLARPDRGLRCIELLNPIVIKP